MPEYKPGSITDEQWNAWNLYRWWGGDLEIYDWLDAGEPEPSYEALRPYAQDVADYLNYLIAEGRMTLPQAKAAGEEALAQGREEGYHAGLPYIREIEDIRAQEVRRQTTLEKQAAARAATEEETEFQRKRTLAMAAAAEETAKQRPVWSPYSNEWISQERAKAEPYLLKTPREAFPIGISGSLWPGELQGEPPPEPTVPYQPIPRYALGAEKTRLGLTGPQPWKEWFESQFPTFLNRFKAALPAYKGLVPESQLEAETSRIEKTWAEYLKKEEPKAREEWASLSPYQRGERPGAYAPKVRTVAF